MNNNNYIKFFAVICIFTSLLTWGMDLFALIDPCAYCRTQRTSIGIVGIILLLPFSQYFVLRYIGNIFGSFAAIIATLQHFHGWQDISKGSFHFTEPFYSNPFLLSGTAFAVLILQIMILNYHSCKN